MYKSEKLIVVSNFESFKSNWNVDCTPVLNNGNYILPLGWEKELQDKNIAFEVKEVDVYNEDFI